MSREWPVLLVSAALLLASGAQALLDDGNLGVLGGALLALGCVCMGAWIGGPRRGIDEGEAGPAALHDPA